MSTDLEVLRKEALAAIEQAAGVKELEAARVKYLGRKGEITKALKSIGSLPPEERRDFARSANRLKADFQQALDAKAGQLEKSAPVEVRTGQDPTLPPVGAAPGSLHPITLVLERFEEVLEGLGYNFIEAPDIDTTFNNFDSLNVPEWHPARDMHDTFFVYGGSVLRTHTTSFHMHVMKKYPPPIRAFTMGRCYRSDKPDAGHSFMFHQLDLVAVDKTDVSFGHLKGLLMKMLRSVFGESTELRFRPSYFPFTGISAEVDATCLICGGRGCSVCKQTGWVELLGCGVVRPEVLRHGGIDPDVYGGFAFGIGIERVAMLLAGVPDMRILFESDTRFLEQFSI